MRHRVTTAAWAVALVLGARTALAACPTDGYESCGTACVQACDASFASVSAAVAAAVSGDSVQVPAGTATWTSELAIDKGIHLRGAGIGATTITSGIDDLYSTHLVSYAPADPTANELFELSGFSFDGSYTSGILAISSNSGTVAISNLKVHDNAFSNANSRAISLGGLEFGAFYANQFTDNYIAISVIGSELDGWNYPLAQGGPNYPFFEDNSFDQTVARGGFIVETGRGGRIVFRHNKIQNYGGNGGEVFDAHGVTGTYPTDNGSVSCEYYANDIGLSAGSRVLNHRGGKMIFANNTVTGASGWITMTEYQAWSYCTSDPYPKPEQVSDSYFWNDTTEGSALEPSLCCSSSDCGCAGGQKCSPPQYDDTFIQLNRDYWLPTSGPDAARPASCNPGDVYGASDDGKLYVCKTADSWTLLYQPYTYPHPLAGGSAGAAGATGAGGSAGASGSGGASAGTGGAATALGGASSGGTTSAGGKAGASSSDSGCGCRLSRKTPSKPLVLLLAATGLALLRRRQA